MSRWEIVTTTSGAPAMRDTLVGEVMHPTVGPLVESQQLYVAQSGLAQILDGLEGAGDPYVVFDVGLGAGANAAALLRAANSSRGRRLHVVSFERDLDALRLALTRPIDFGLDAALTAAARRLLEDGHVESERFTWELIAGELPGTLALAVTPADLVIWDPFSPAANPSLWSVAAFTELRAHVADRARLFTYSSSTGVRAALLLAGFAVGVGAPIGRKRETTAAAVAAHDLAHPLDARWLERLGRTSVPLPEGAAATIARCPQFQSTNR